MGFVLQFNNAEIPYQASQMNLLAVTSTSCFQSWVLCVPYNWTSKLPWKRKGDRATE